MPPEAIQKAVELSPKDAEAHNNLAILLKDLGQLEEAEANLRHAQNFPSQEHTLLQRALMGKVFRNSMA